MLRCEPVTSQLIDYLCKGSIAVEILGRHRVSSSVSSVDSVSRPTTRQLLRADRRVFSRFSIGSTGYLPCVEPPRPKFRWIEFQNQYFELYLL